MLDSHRSMLKFLVHENELFSLQNQVCFHRDFSEVGLLKIGRWYVILPNIMVIIIRIVMLYL